jgi:large subunit ribosomal protein L24
VNKIRKGDKVIVLTGKNKGLVSTVISRVDESYLLVDGVNLVKKHMKPNPMKNIVGGVVEKSLPIHQSNIAIFNAATGKADRVGVKVLDDTQRALRKTKQKSIRVFKSNSEEIRV